MDLPLPEHQSEHQQQAERRRLWRSALISAGFVALLWWIALLQHAFELPLRGLTLRPGEWTGLIGVLSAPLLHASLAHLVSNTLPLLILGTLTLASLPRAAPRSLLLIWMLAGLGTWLIGRPSAHLGASGIGHGLMFFLFIAGLIRRDRPAIATALLVFFLYGGMVLTVLPREEGVSWEYHLCGAIAGALAAWRWARLDPTPPRRRYSWEDEAEELQPDQEFRLPPPQDVPVLWRREETNETNRPEPRGQVLRFPARSPDVERGND
ncbi:rhomboid family intramembrane serine protease [Pseudomarimonas arenosa]|uniref:Rhomboid family intramembrane serine protease n=1 Tax=Pseudomarimonas arenosa TaxID=2774145 RepID=A0AAW3ZKZ4_9GAMM|nr:rhomboid family intramembrane serine protease [Pseudomarimonas arenosa]MBD8525737.1 rhomboid family intramembrane serine protease [Pseudomarimonas arenosa]